MPRHKVHKSVEAAWSYLLHMEDESPNSKENHAFDTKLEESELSIPFEENASLLLCMVGKPTRGKSMIAMKIMRYLQWMDYTVECVNFKQKRRALFPETSADAFFDYTDSNFDTQSEETQKKCLEMILKCFENKTEIVIYDAMNATRSDRQSVLNAVNSGYSPNEGNGKCRILWIELADDNISSILEKYSRYRSTAKANNFCEWDTCSDDEAQKRFLERLAHYDKIYETLSANHEVDKNLSFIKLFESSRRMETNQIVGAIESKIVPFCMHMKSSPQTVILVRHGQSEYNLQDRIGGDPHLSIAGEQFGANLTNYINTHASSGLNGEDTSFNTPGFSVEKDLTIWTSDLTRTVETVKAFKPRSMVACKSLSEIDAGVCECMTYDEFKTNLPSQYLKRSQNKATWRFPGGESYADVKQRLEPMIFEIEKQTGPVLICSHRAVLRCLYGYFLGIPLEKIPHLTFPLHTAIIVSSTNSGWHDHRIILGPTVEESLTHASDLSQISEEDVKEFISAKRKRDNKVDEW